MPCWRRALALSSISIAAMCACARSSRPRRSTGCVSAPPSPTAAWRACATACSRLADLVERAYIALGGTNVIHFFGVTPMTDPSIGVPTQFVANRKVKAGDAVVAEISAAFWEYPGQVLRSFAVDAEPSPLYRDLHAAADAAFDAVAAVLKDGTMPSEVIDAASVIEQAGFTIIDDLLHGYGGGYLPPELGSRSRPSAHIPDEPLRAGMTVVIQPNVVTPDGKAGVQTGELVLVTATGIELLHAMPRGFVRV